MVGELNPVVGASPLRNLAARSILETAPRGAVPGPAPHTYHAHPQQTAGHMVRRQNLLRHLAGLRK